MRRVVPLLLAACPLAVSAEIAQQPGLWEVTITIHPGEGMPDLPPEALLLMEQAGLQNPFKPFSREVCVTPDQVAKGAVPAFQDEDSGCAVTNGQRKGDVITADFACNGDIKGKGDLKTTLTSPTSYVGDTRFAGSGADGMVLNMTSDFRGKWLAASCGRVQPIR
ncbi:MAG TPA: DUF3617 domain-containing protein [Nevskiaceae bacterium]|nr:DUF3617 domain-containing protein [Nevskiaceae bacterium]